MHQSTYVIAWRIPGGAMRRRVLIPLGGLAATVVLAGTVAVSGWASAATPAAAPSAGLTRAEIVATMKLVDDYWVKNGTDQKANNWRNATFHVGNLALGAGQQVRAAVRPAGPVLPRRVRPRRGVPGPADVPPGRDHAQGAPREDQGAGGRREGRAREHVELRGRAEHGDAVVRPDRREGQERGDACRDAEAVQLHREGGRRKGPVQRVRRAVVAGRQVRQHDHVLVPGQRLGRDGDGQGAPGAAGDRQAARRVPAGADQDGREARDDPARGRVLERQPGQPQRLRRPGDHRYGDVHLRHHLGDQPQDPARRQIPPDRGEWLDRDGEDRRTEQRAARLLPEHRAAARGRPAGDQEQRHRGRGRGVPARRQPARHAGRLSYPQIAAPGAGLAHMRGWLIGLGVAVGLVVLGWALLLLAARRLPPGLLRDLAAFIPDCVTTVRRLRRDPRVPRRAKVAVVLAGLWVASPIDLIPEFLPVIGPLDDIVVALALRYAGRQVPRDVLIAAWPGQPRLLERLLGPASGGPAPGGPAGPAAEGQR